MSVFTSDVVLITPLTIDLTLVSSVAHPAPPPPWEYDLTYTVSDCVKVIDEVFQFAYWLPCVLVNLATSLPFFSIIKYPLAHDSAYVADVTFCNVKVYVEQVLRLVRDYFPL